MLLSLLATIFIVGSCHGMNFTHHLFLDPEEKYEMWWKFNDEEITFKLRVETQGWIGWGLSSNGKMLGSDIILAWFDENGNPILQDSHASSKSNGHVIPIKDEQQDYELIEMKKDGGNTTIVFKRKLIICNDEDSSISADTQRVIWAYGESKTPSYHLTARNTHSLLLLDYADQNAANTLPEGTISQDYRMLDNDTLEAKDTIYMCRVFKAPQLSQKHHLVRVEPIVQKGHETLVHHILLFSCDGIDDESWLYKQEIDVMFHRKRMLSKDVDDKIQHDCASPNMPDHVRNCGRILIHAWAVGGTAFNYPKDIGLPIGGLNGSKYFFINVHYDNPRKVNTYKDKSGFRLYFTPNLQKYEAGVIAMGLDVKEYSPIIPPKQKNFKVTGYCSSDCLDVKEEGPKIFATFLHAHLQGAKIITRLVNDATGVETKRISQDMSYDFNFQETKTISKDNYIEILPGHSIHIECVYNTENKNTTTLGGRSTKEEMCFAFLWLYPFKGRVRCVSYNPDVFGTFQSKELGWKIVNNTIAQDLILDGKNYNKQPAYKALQTAQVWNDNPGLAKKWKEYSSKPKKVIQKCKNHPSHTVEPISTKRLPDSACQRNDRPSSASKHKQRVAAVTFQATILSIVLAANF